ncbi:helix-turn-helix domain-containing protein [Maribellus sp. YY47]|uniref:helix-turn-helix domain-containing protein n=1 Tax=Maribellus sp. YY47 TaxID=2929486 RepID=UPI002001213C|nr:helix-turn-helix domain-containing protein [Maribellus sp. YY47]MCK3684380.1 helix-turn-helix domain-containing protein [Maribellus sp. YY47]
MNDSNFNSKDFKNVQFVFTAGELYKFHKETEGTTDSAFIDSMMQKAFEIRNSYATVSTKTSDPVVHTSTDLPNLTSNSELADSSEKEDKQITRKEAMRILNVRTVLTMIRWEEKGILNPLRINSRIRYWKSEVLNAAESFQRIR